MANGGDGACGKNGSPPKADTLDALTPLHPSRKGSYSDALGGYATQDQNVALLGQDEGGELHFAVSTRGSSDDEPAHKKQKRDSMPEKDQIDGHRQGGSTDASKSATAAPDKTALPTSDHGACSNNCDTTEVTTGRPPSKHTRSKKLDPKVLNIRRQIQLGCRDNDLEAAMKVYDEAVQADIHLEAQTFYSLLNLCDGLERTVHVGTPKAACDASAGTASPVPISHIDNRTRQEYVFRVKGHMKRLNLPLNETAYTAIVKVLVRNGDFEKAEEVLNEAETVQQCKPRLRLYSSLMVAYCEHRLMIKALKCWLRIIKHKLELTEKEFLALIKCAIATGDVPVMDRVLSDIAELVPVPSKDTVSAILQWFESPHALIHVDPLRIPKRADADEVKRLLQDIHNDEVEPPPSMGPVQTKNQWQSSSSVRIDAETGTLLGGCLVNCKLKPVPLSERVWSDMMDMNEAIVLDGKLEGNASDFQGGRKGQIRRDFDPQKRKTKWNEFVNFLEANGPIDVVIDAANVGYFKQNFAAAPKHVDYEQIDWVVRKLQSMGKKVLLVLHQRHFSLQLMPRNFKPIQDEWERSGILYKTPAGMNDDWFWLHAALKHRTLVVTNDEMRDHHFQMLAPRTFLRWKERHQVHFSFSEWEDENGDNSQRKRREVDLKFPSPYSRRIQRVGGEGLVVPLIKQGDENRFLDGSHVAEADEPLEETYLCIKAFFGTP
jgi:mitochondrial ribonuclease P protein 3